MTAPTDTTFSAGTKITSQWLNGVNDHVNNLEADPHPSYLSKIEAATIYTTQADLASSAAGKGAELIGFKNSAADAVDRTVAEKCEEFVTRDDFSSDAAFNTAKSGKLSRDASGRLRTATYIAGTEELTAPATRDAFVVGRSVIGSTDCHGFADRTIMSGVTDAGTYGCFDTTVKLQGSHTQNHVFGFQDRVDYQGSGILENQAGIYSGPKFSGSGTWQNRYGVYVLNVDKTGSGTLENNIGVYVLNQTAGTINVGINVAQTTGYTFYCAGGAKSYHAGSFGIGTSPADGVKLHVAGGSGAGDVAVYVAKTGGYSYYAPGTGKFWQAGLASFGTTDNTSDGVALTARGASSGPRAFLHTTSETVQIGGIGGDYPMWFINNGAVRLEITASTGSYTVRPGSDNTQPLGDVTKRWSQLFAGTATINTSDEREKQDIAELDEVERRVAIKLKGLVKKFRFKDAVAAKGDSARIHVGVIAQEVIAAFQAEGLDPMRYAIVCYDEWPAEMDDEGNEVRPAGNRYGVRYEELLAFIISAL